MNGAYIAIYFIRLASWGTAKLEAVYIQVPVRQYTIIHAVYSEDGGSVSQQLIKGYSTMWSGDFLIKEEGVSRGLLVYYILVHSFEI